MKARRPSSGDSEPPREANDLDAVLESVRSMWAAAEKTEPPVRDWVTKKITEGILRLRQQVQGKLRLATLSFPRQQTLFLPERPEPVVKPPKQKIVDPPAEGPRFPEPALRVYTKDLARPALHQLPNAVQSRSIDEVREYLTNHLRFNSLATRRWYANYLVNRFFPNGVFNSDVLPFAAASAGTPALGEALFYLTCRTEKIVALVADNVVYPSLALGGVARTKVRDFIEGQFPGVKSVKSTGIAVVSTYHTFGIGSANRTHLKVSLREGSLASFAYVLHMEFPEPGMYSFERMFDGPMHKWLLWDQQWMVHQLYRLREAGVLSKVSEIDRLRQFTTKFTLAEAMQPIVARFESDLDLYHKSLAKFLKDPKFFDEEEQEEAEKFLDDLRNSKKQTVRRDCGQKLWRFYKEYLKTTPDRLRVMWQNMRCSMGLYLEQPGG